ncbi:Crp/Fnr family transcriptional regulator [Aeoliella mucimassa]|uniref:Global nitrogen regulator n=1 Tax=Aeoliella mucimassa TaxID=2527972 RepID=A0A518AL20_9BACT|nr:Crp/Fnr family transcriptional regulator [Aeoliella mucimassa]QDU55386.1 Global nitrogen regulator [Aeoliella mucimassa]
MTEKLWFLKSCELFRRLEADDLAMLERRCLSRRFARAAPIYMPADEASGVLLMAEGRAKICSYTDEGKQAILAFVEPGEIFGELALLDSGEREEYAEAVEKSNIIFIPQDVIESLAERHAHVSLGITKLIGLRRRRIERRLKSLLFRSNRERLVSLLLELAEQYGQPTPDGVQLAIKLSHQDLASVIGSTRETVTVLLGELQTEEFLTLGRRKITITALDNLASSIKAPVPRLPRRALFPTV